MARRRSRLQSSDDSAIAPDPLLAGLIEDMSARVGSSDVIVGDEAERIIIGVPLTSFAQRYLYQSSCLPLSRIHHYKGLTESCKTAFAFEILRLHVRMLLACGFYLLNEPRDQPILRRSIVGPHLSKKVKTVKCEKLEDWQDATTNILTSLSKRADKVGACPFVLCSVVDSLMGTASQETVDALMEQGHASRNYGIEANLLNIWTKVVPPIIAKWPITYIVTNHMKVSKDRYGHDIKRTPGGESIRFFSTYELEFQRVKDYKRADSAGRQIMITATKNSLGDARYKMLIDFVWWHEDGNQVSRWDWHGASIDFLDQLHGIETKDTWRRRIGEIVDLDIERKTKKVTSRTLDLKKADYGEASMAIEANPEIRNALDDLFGIHRARPFIPGMDYCDQIQAAKDNTPIEELLPGGLESVFEPENPVTEAEEPTEDAA